MMRLLRGVALLGLSWRLLQALPYPTHDKISSEAMWSPRWHASLSTSACRVLCCVWLGGGFCPTQGLPVDGSFALRYGSFTDLNLLIVEFFARTTTAQRMTIS